VKFFNLFCLYPEDQLKNYWNSIIFWHFEPCYKVTGVTLYTTVSCLIFQGSKLTNEEINNETSHGIALEPHHLWEYPCRALTEEFTIMKFDFTSNIPSQKMTSEGNVNLKR